MGSQISCLVLISSTYPVKKERKKERKGGKKKKERKRGGRKAACIRTIYGKGGEISVIERSWGEGMVGRSDRSRCSYVNSATVLLRSSISSRAIPAWRILEFIAGVCSHCNH